MSESVDDLLPAITGNHHPLHASRARVVAYLTGIVLPPFLMLVFGLFILPSQWYTSRSGNRYLANLGFGESLRNADCKIVIYGDSSAMINADPAIIEKTTGLSTCNIAEYAGVTFLNGTMVVDRYMANNARPRYLVFLFAPESYGTIPDWKDIEIIEALSYRLRYGRDFSTAVFIVKHLSEVLSYVEHQTRFLLTHPRSKPWPPALMELRKPLGGRLSISGPTLRTCTPVRESEIRKQWISLLRSQYGSPETTVLIDVSPTPDCDQAFSYYHDRLRSLADNDLIRYPDADFIDNGRLHMNDTGMRRFSLALGTQILNAKSRTK